MNLIEISARSGLEVAYQSSWQYPLLFLGFSFTRLRSPCHVLVGLLLYLGFLLKRDPKFLEVLLRDCGNVAGSLLPDFWIIRPLTNIFFSYLERPLFFVAVFPLFFSEEEILMINCTPLLSKCLKILFY